MANSQVKFNRTYVLTVETAPSDPNVNPIIIGPELTIKPPFTLEFDVNRHSFASTNTATFKIYNLGETTRNKLRYDYYDLGQWRFCSLKVGYLGTSALPITSIIPGTLSTVFQGTVKSAFSVRQGVDFITTIVAEDPGFAYCNSQSDGHFIAGTTAGVAMSKIISEDLDGVGLGYISPSYNTSPYQLLRTTAYSEPTFHLLDRLSGNGFFVDNGLAYAIPDSEFNETVDTFVVNSNSGLLGTPVINDQSISVDMLLEPRLSIGKRIFLESTTNTKFVTNRFYKVTGLHHRGVISGSVCGDATTTMTALYARPGNTLGGFIP